MYWNCKKNNDCHCLKMHVLFALCTIKITSQQEVHILTKGYNANFHVKQLKNGKIIKCTISKQKHSIRVSRALFLPHPTIVVTAFAILIAGLGTAFFSVLNILFFSVLLKNAMFFSVFILSFWRIMEPKRTLHSFPFFS